MYLKTKVFLKKKNKCWTICICVGSYQQARKARVLNQSPLQTRLDDVRIYRSFAPDDRQNVAVKPSAVEQTRRRAQWLLRQLLQLAHQLTADSLVHLSLHSSSSAHHHLVWWDDESTNRGGFSVDEEGAGTSFGFRLAKFKAVVRGSGFNVCLWAGEVLQGLIDCKYKGQWHVANLFKYVTSTVSLLTLEVHIFYKSRLA